MGKEDKWYEAIERRINIFRENISDDIAERYKVDLILDIAENTHKHSEECDLCQEFKYIVYLMVISLQNINNWNEDDEEKYFNNIDELKEHLYLEHGVELRENQNNLLMYLGIVIGAILGLILIGEKGLIIGPPLGMVIGIVLRNNMNAE